MASLTPLEALRAIVARLRAPGGCPWDREQTHTSLRGSLLEEAHEVAEAIDERDDAHLCEELGDLLLQVVMHSDIAEGEGRFTLDDVARGITEKLIRRHPHVFGTGQVEGSAGVVQQWEEIKKAERASRGEKTESALDGVSGALPALLRAEKITKKAAKVGFDWETAEQVLGKVREELAETEEVLAQNAPHERVEEEIGDLLFAIANLARKSGVEGEVALRRATTKFGNRFRRVEAELAKRGKTPQSSTLEEMDAIWDTIKHAP